MKAPVTASAGLMNRREALQQLICLIGGSMAAPALFSPASRAWSAQAPASFLDPAQGATVAEIAEIMIPRTSTPGARDVGVPAFIDVVLKNVYAPVDQQRYLAGLKDFEARATSTYGQPFMELDAPARAALVQAVNDEAVAGERRAQAVDPHPTRPFILMTKEITMLGYFCSEIGATKVLQYVAIPGSWHGCLPLSQAGNGRTWARETSNPF
jgi:hypothetical protein